MNISIFTPTHNSSHLLEAYNSFKDQDFFEWVIVPNKNPDMSVLPNDPRIKIIPHESELIGELKSVACNNCTGDFFLELDHDDLLTSDAIYEIKKAISENPNVGFFYSNTVEFRETPDGIVPNTFYGSQYGWQYKPYNHNGINLHETLSFKPHPATITKIWYAPNHLRLIRKEEYFKCGGYNPKMRVLDDQDIMSRLYQLTDFYHINKPLYLYRITGGNSWLTHNKEIQENVMPIYNKYIESCSLAWSNRNNLKNIELGAGHNHDKRYTGVDLQNSDIIANLDYKWPFEDNSVGVIKANDFIEHVKDPIHLMKEAYRVLADGGMFLISVPSTDGRGAFQDPTHVSFWNQNSFWYYTRQDQNRFINCPVRFQKTYLETKFPSDWHKQHNISYVYAHLLAVKSNYRYPGELEI